MGERAVELTSSTALQCTGEQLKIQATGLTSGAQNLFHHGQLYRKVETRKAATAKKDI